jgi:hypothetical protein
MKLLFMFILITVGLMGCAPHVVAPPVLSEVRAAQVVSVSDSTLTAHVGHQVHVYGAGFAFGAVVTLNGVPTSSRVDDENLLRVAVDGLEPGRYELAVTNPSARSSVLRDAFVVTQQEVWSCANVTVSFTEGRFVFGPEQSKDLDPNLACFDARGDALLVEGFARDHFSTEFALAAGYQRAALVATVLAKSGVKPSQLRLITYGREDVPGAEIGSRARVEIAAGMSYPLRVIPASQVYGLPELTPLP